VTAPPRPPALLLLGPTGSGKTPLGEHLARHGLRGRPCVHFDFGARLRAVADGSWRPAGLGAKDVETVVRALGAGALLTDAEFGVAASLLRACLAEQRLAPGGLLVLNGLPRHVGQARDLEPLVDLRAAVHLDASADVVCQRIARDSGGDRTGRDDDSALRIAERLVRFEERTRPLIAWLGARGVPVQHLPVCVATRAGDLAHALGAPD
jgi:adenylate kinase family enzyme